MSLIALYPLAYIVFPIIYTGYYKISGLEKKRNDELEKFIEDERLYGMGFDKPISEDFRLSSISAKNLCISKTKDSLAVMLNEDKEHKKLIQDIRSKNAKLISDSNRLIKEINKKYRVNQKKNKTVINDIKPKYDFISSIYGKVENRSIECIDQGSAGYGNKSLGLKIGEICEFMPHIKYTKTKLIPDENSIDDPNWNATVEMKYYLYDSFPYDCKI